MHFIHFIAVFPLAAFLNAVAGTATLPTAATSDILWVNCSQNVPSTLDTTSVDLTNLPSTLYCGEIVVPMDYSKPLDEGNNITLGLAMYRPATATKGVLFL